MPNKISLEYCVEISKPDNIGAIHEIVAKIMQAQKALAAAHGNAIECSLQLSQTLFIFEIRYQNSISLEDTLRRVFYLTGAPSYIKGEFYGDAVDKALAIYGKKIQNGNNGDYGYVAKL